MKLTEQQLSQLFKQAKTTEIQSSVTHLNNFSEASDARISAAEKIADNSQLSESYKVINQLLPWSQSLATDITATREDTSQSVIEGLFAWLKPMMATAALATVVYISYPQFESSQITPTSTSEKEVFTANFEDTTSSNAIQLPSKTTITPQSDIIYSGGFG